MTVHRGHRVSGRPRRARRVVLPLVGLLILLLTGALVTVGVLRSRPLTLPNPTGAHPVGRVITTVTVSSDGLDGTRRAAWIWYPADPESAGRAPVADYAPSGWVGPDSLPPTIGAGWFLQDISVVRGRSRSEPEVASGRHRVLLLAPGYETAPWMYSSMAEELASQGLIVALLVPSTTPARVVDGQPRTTASVGLLTEPDRIDALFEAQAADLRSLYAGLAGSAIDLLAGAVDPSGAVFGGHSLGGGAAVLACEREPRCSGSINLDGPLPVRPASGPAKPSLLLASDRSCAAMDPCADAGLPEGYVDWVASRRAGSPPTVIAMISGSGHNAFGDPVHYFVAPGLSGLAGTGGISAARMQTVLNAVLPATIDQLVRGAGLEGLPELPELVPVPR